MNMTDEDLLLILRALYWYNDKVSNQITSTENLIERENIEFLRQIISTHIKDKSFLL